MEDTISLVTPEGALELNIEQTPLVPPSAFQFSLINASSPIHRASIAVDASIVGPLFEETAHRIQPFIHTPGFAREAVPITYVKHHFRENMIEHLKEFLLKFCVINYLYKSLREQKIVLIGEPTLSSITIADDLRATYTFEFWPITDLSIYDWKYLPFKPPKRKNYKDIDRQVEFFIEDERKRGVEVHDGAIKAGDWVKFSLILVSDHHRLPPEVVSQFWLYIGDDETEGQLRDLFLGKKIGDTFSSSHLTFLRYLSDQLEAPYVFMITILDIVHEQTVCMEMFKKHFRLKSNKEVHKKFIEVFSFRHDISQRRGIVEEMYKLLLSKHAFLIPEQLIIFQQKIILTAMRDNPDYTVYRAQKDFENQLRTLAYKQLKETVLTDALGYHENIPITDHDIKAYLNLIKRARTREFIHFHLPEHLRNGEQIPLPDEVVRRICLREKTLNHIVYHLMKA